MSMGAIRARERTTGGHLTVIALTDHSAYDWNFIAEHASLIIDTRNAAKNVARRHRNRICPVMPR